MKKLNLSIRSLFILCLAAVSVAANAQQVSQEEAANIALQFLKGNGSQNSRLKKATPEALKLVYTEPSAKDKSANLYVYNMEGGGFAIVSADARTGSQILGYSFDNNFSAKGMPDNVKYWLGEYSRQIDFIKAHQPEVSESKRRERLKMEDAPTPPENVTIKVPPMLSTTWGQDAPYNGMTPTLEGQHTRTGCVATAMAQIMKKWKHPTTGTGFHTYNWTVDGINTKISSNFNEHTYDWDNMTNSYDNNSTDGEKEAVAQLMYDCGVAVDMDYGLESSGALDENVIDALKYFFGYSHKMSLEHQSDYSKAAWTKLLTDELDAGRPVYYAAEDENDDDAHAFVLDGYGTINNETYFHINWGWDGYGHASSNSTDGYFAMNSFSPLYRATEEIDDYNENAVAIIGITPKTESENTFDELTAGWDVAGNWKEPESNPLPFTYGVWNDNDMYMSQTKQQEIQVKQNITYNCIYKITMPSWRESAILGPIGESGYTSVTDSREEYANDDLFFYWNSETNDCYFPTQYTGLYKNKISSPNLYSYELYVNPSKESYPYYGSYDPLTKQFKLKFYTYTLEKKSTTTGPNKTIDDPEGLLSSEPTSGNDYSTYQIKQTGQYANDYLLWTTNYNWTSTFSKSEAEFPLTIQGPATATLTLDHPIFNEDQKGLYLGNFTEDTDGTGEYTGTATQYAGIIKNVIADYRIGIMPVDKNTTEDDIISYVKGNLVNDMPDIQNKNQDASATLHELTIPEEGAYYVVAAYYDDAQGTNFLSYEYLPVFYSSSDKWETLEYGEDELEDDINFTDDILYYVYYLTTPYSKVDVQQYKGGNLINNTGDRLFRIKNPYGSSFATSYYPWIWSQEEDSYVGDKEHPVETIYNINHNNPPYRTDVYLYLYVDAENNVSFYPNCFEYQPLGTDWGKGEMMVKQDAIGQYDETDNTIKFEDTMYLVEYFDGEEQETNEDYDTFLLQLPQDSKYYLTLVDNQPYTDESGSTDYYKGAYYSRELGINNDWGTLMLPFDFNTNKIEGFEFYKLTRATTEWLTFSKYDGENVLVEANTPIVFKRTVPTKSLEVFEESNSGCLTISSCNGIKGGEAVDDWTFVGVYYNSTDEGNEDKAITEESTDPSLAQCYFFEGNEIWNVTARMDLYQYRGYFRYDGTSNLAKRIPVRFNDEEYTSLDALFNGEQPVKKYGKGRFNLQGQAVGKDYKGVVIEDGRKKISY